VDEEPPSWPDEDLYGSLESDDELEPLARPAWWRWVAIAIVVTMVVAGPVAYALFRLLD
jgi:hypothetical protein